MAKKTLSKSDGKLTALRIVRLAVLAALAAVIIWAALSLRGNFNSEGVRRMRSYFSDLFHGGLRFTECEYDQDLKTMCVPIGGGMGVYTGDTYYFASDLGTRDRTQLNYLDPTISRGGDYLMIYDRGGTGVFMASSFGVVLNRNLDSDILYAEVNPRGYITVVTNEAGYRTGLTVYDKKMNVCFKWQTPDYYILSCALSPDGRKVSALCLTAGGEELESLIRVFDVSGKSETLTYTAPGKPVRICCGEEELYILGLDGLYSLKDGSISALANYDELLTYSMRSGERPAVCGKTGIEIRLIVPDRFDTLYKEAPVSCDYSDGSLAMLFKDEIIVRTGTAVKQYPVSGCRAIALSKNGPVAFYADHAELVTEGKNE